MSAVNIKLSENGSRIERRICCPARLRISPVDESTSKKLASAPPNEKVPLLYLCLKLADELSSDIGIVSVSASNIIEAFEEKVSVNVSST